MRTARRFSGMSAGLVLLGLCSGAVPAAAQPSGGPYGPVGRTYEIPVNAGKIFYVAPDGAASRPGAAPDSPTTIESAIERARTGDAIIMRGGVYRTGGLLVNQGITVQPYADEKPVMKGSLAATQWEDLGNGLWTAKWTHLFPSAPDSWWRREREGKKTPLHRFNNDMVFIDGRFLQSAGWEGEVDSNSFYIDYTTGTVYIGANPAGRLVEITAFDVAILRTTANAHGRSSDRRGYTLRGITFTQYAYRALEIQGTDPEGPSPESKHGKEVVGTTLEDCAITFCSRVAGYFRGDSMTIRRCKVSDTSTEGLYIIGSNDVLLEKNVIARNNIEKITGYYPAGVKIFNQCHRVTCNDNLVTDQPNSNGIWYDVGNVDGVFTNNLIEGVGRAGGPFDTGRLWPSDNGFFFEISKGAVCAGNVFVDCDHGIMVLNSSNVRMYQNTFVNSMACIGRDARSAQGDHFGWHPSTGPDVGEREGHEFVNNLLTGDGEFGRSLLFVWQAPAICAQVPGPQLRRLEHNVFVRDREQAAYPLILWSPAPNGRCQAGFGSPEELRSAFPGFSAGSLSFAGYDGPLFTGAQVGDYRTMPSSPAASAGEALPPDIGRLLPGYRNSPYAGAYPPRP